MHFTTLIAAITTIGAIAVTANPVPAAAPAPVPRPPQSTCIWCQEQVDKCNAISGLTMKGSGPTYVACMTTLFSTCKGCTEPAPKNERGYVPGQCGVHITQYQKPVPGVDPYTFDAGIDDYAAIPIGEIKGLATFEPFQVTSLLPWTLVITPGHLDSDPIRFSYADQHWDSNSAQCKFGGYENGNREGDCGFQC